MIHTGKPSCAASVVRHFFAHQWYLDHVFQDAATTQFLPQLVQQDFGYTASWAGLVLSPGGVVTMVMMFVVGRVAAKVQPNISSLPARYSSGSRCTA